MYTVVKMLKKYFTIMYCIVSFFIDKAVADLLAFGIDNDQNWYRYQLAGHYWKMGADKLLCLDCTPGIENTP